MSKRVDNLKLAADIERLINRLAGVVAMVEKAPEKADTIQLRLLLEKLEKVLD